MDILSVERPHTPSTKWTPYLAQQLPWIWNDGIDLDAYLPVKNPGDYYLRAAIKDRTSGKIGSAYQFLEIPEFSKRRLSLSSIFMLGPGENASAIKSGNIDDNSSASMQRRRALSKSPALRSYLPGESFDYLVFVYNAKTGEGNPAKLEFQSALFKDGQVYYLEKPEAISLNVLDDMGRIPILKRLTFGSDMDEGNYLLQLIVTDRQSSGKPRIAVQAIDFQIRKGS